MSRSLVLANGELHIGLNSFAEVSDLYYPYVGLENHLASPTLCHRIGIWVDNDFSWLDSDSWSITSRYHDGSMIGHSDAYNKLLGIYLEFDDCVDSSQAAFLRNIHVINKNSISREVKLYIHQAFDISNNRSADTATYLPEQHAILHYKGQRAFVINARHVGGHPFNDFTIGVSTVEGERGSYSEAEAGRLPKRTSAHGRGDSMVALHATIDAHSSARFHYWLCAGRSISDALKINDRVLSNGFHGQFQTTERHWREWVSPARATIKKLDVVQAKILTDSLLIIKAHTDKRGAVMSSLDTTLRNHSRDTYAFCWPREASYALWPLLRLGFKDELVQFFGFCKRVLHQDGYMAHKYQPDGAVGSSWYPFTANGTSVEQPIQSDETASVLFLMGQYHRQYEDKKLLSDLYSPLIAKMANFLATYVGENHLPLPSYDIWEQRYLTTTYTTAVTYAALLEASELADIHGEQKDAVRWRSAAEDMQAAASELFNHTEGYFYRGIISNHRKKPEYDKTIDASSLYGVFMYGLFPLDSPEMVTASKTASSLLSNRGDRRAYIRYAGDNYRRLSENDESNISPLVSLWFAQLALEKGQSKQAKDIIDLISACLQGANNLPEQIDPHHFAPVSVSPFVWAQAELANTLLDCVSDIGGQDAA